MFTETEFDWIKIRDSKKKRKEERKKEQQMGKDVIHINETFFRNAFWEI